MALGRTHFVSFALFHAAAVAAITGSAQATIRQPDFDGDGKADLVVPIPREDIGGAEDAGAVAVLYGTGNGIKAGGSQLWHQNVSGVEDNCETNEFFGAAVAWGDFNGDGYSDLAIGVPFEDGAGAVNVLYGSATGLKANDDEIWRQGSGGLLDSAEALDAFGAALAVGDFNGDGFDDLAVGAPGESVNGQNGAGAVSIIFGTPSKLTADSNQFITQDTAGIADSAEAGDAFGASLAAGDFNGNGKDDLAIGVPGEDVSGQVDAGAVNVLPGSASGLSASGDKFWHQNSTNVLDEAEANDRFGASLASGDFDGDGHDDLAIGVPFESVGAVNEAGAVNVLYGTSSGLKANSNQLWTQNSAGIVDSCEDFDRFGTLLAAGNFDGDGRDDLLIGVPFEGVGAQTNAGQVHCIFGTGNGLAAGGDQLINQDTPGIADTAETDDRFGSMLVVGDFDGDGNDDVGIGVPLETVGGVSHAGAVNVILGSSSGLTDAGDSFWNQDKSGIADTAEEDDNFGSADFD